MPERHRAPRSCRRQGRTKRRAPRRTTQATIELRGAWHGTSGFETRECYHRDVMYPLFRPFLFALDPETAHDMVFAGLDAAARIGLAKAFAPQVPDAPVSAMGLEFPNRVGLAAGLDKNAAHIDALAGLGFGFVECGTVTPRAQPGNPRPRLF